MAKAKTTNDVQQVAALASSANDQLNKLYNTLGLIVTAMATLNDELSELPKPQDVQEVAAALAQLRHELRWFVEPEWQIPNASDLQEAAEAASTLAAELTRMDQSKGRE